MTKGLGLHRLRFQASRDYDPAPQLGRIRAALLAVNFADDAVNAAEQGVMDA